MILGSQYWGRRKISTENLTKTGAFTVSMALENKLGLTSSAALTDEIKSREVYMKGIDLSYSKC